MSRHPVFVIIQLPHFQMVQQAMHKLLFAPRIVDNHLICGSFT